MAPGVTGITWETRWPLGGSKTRGSRRRSIRTCHGRPTKGSIGSPSNSQLVVLDTLYRKISQRSSRKLGVFESFLSLFELVVLEQIHVLGDTRILSQASALFLCHNLKQHLKLKIFQVMFWFFKKFQTVSFFFCDEKKKKFSGRLKRAQSPRDRFPKHETTCKRTKC